MNGIFKDNAPGYWRAGLPGIPLRPRHKAPVPNGWQVFCSQMPDESTREAWLRMFADGNIGLPLGPCSGLVAIDLDTDDEKITTLIERLIPVTPWVRRGKKGAVYLFRSPASAEHRTFRIKDINGNSLVECLAKGTQIVLPPSIHPDTQKPYTATAYLPDVLAQLPNLPKDIETIIRGALSEAGVELSTRGSAKMVEWVAAGARDSSLVSICGLEARAVIRGERTLNEALGEIETWIVNFTERVAGDSISVEKGRAKLIEFIKRDITEGKRSLPAGWDEGLAQADRDAAAKEFGEDSEEWTVERCSSYLDTAFEAHDRNTTGRRKAIEEVLARMSRSATMTTLDKEQVLTHIHGCSGKTVTLSSMRKRLRELEQGEIEGVDHTEIAQQLIKEQSRFGEIRIDGDKLWQWKGAHWEGVLETQLMESIARDYGHMVAARKHNDHRGILRVAENLIPKGLKDSPLIGINFANGFLTSDLVLHKHDPKFGCTYVLPCLYDPERAAAPRRFLSFLHHSWGDDPDYADKVQALREALAATMFQQAYKFQKAICLMGVPESGKSVLKDIVNGMMPEGSVSTVPPQDWNDKFLPTMMLNKLINYCGELSETAMIAGDKFKSIIDGDEISGQHKNRPIFQFRPLCAQWFNTNHIPRTKDSSPGFTRRWLFLRFNKAVPRHERIVGLAFEILAEERDAIAAWAVGAMPELMANNGYTEPKSSLELVREMGSLTDSVRGYLRLSERVRVIKGGEVRCPERELFDAYFNFCRTVTHDKPVTLKTFRVRMMAMQAEWGFEVEVCRTASGQESVFYLGICLSSDYRNQAGIAA